MPPMERDKHEEILNQLNNPELTHTERSELLQNLREDYAQVHGDFEELTNKANSLKEENDDLTHANSKLFRQLGFDKDDSKDEEQEKKSFSETVTIESLTQK